MAKKLTWMVVLAFLVVAAGVMTAEEKNPFGIEWDAEAVAQMSKEERMAYQQAYKAAVEEAARQNGGVRPGDKAGQPVGRTAPMPAKVPGTSITYHSGALSGSPVSSFSVGNQFDTALTSMGTAIGSVEMSGSITMFSADMASVSGNVFFSVFDQQAGTTANLITSFSTGPLTTGANSITLGSPINYVGNTFLAGVWNFGADVVNVATGTVGGQGFHGMSINDVTGTAFNRYTMTNGAVGVSGDVATPVELMLFSVEE